MKEVYAVVIMYTVSGEKCTWIAGVFNTREKADECAKQEKEALLARGDVEKAYASVVITHLDEEN